MAGPGGSRQGTAGEVRHGGTCLGEARCGLAGVARTGASRQGPSGPGKARQAGHGVTGGRWLGIPRRVVAGKAWQGAALHGMVTIGMVGSVRQAALGFVGQGRAARGGVWQARQEWCVSANWGEARLGRPGRERIGTSGGLGSGGCCAVGLGRRGIHVSARQVVCPARFGAAGVVGEDRCVKVRWSRQGRVRQARLGGRG
jgi:hypothetical protein